MASKPNWIDLSNSQQDELNRFVHAPGWRVVVGNELPSVFPERFRAKIDSALIIAAPTSTGGTYLAFSATRVDLKAGALDIEPFGVIVHSTGTGPSGVFIHHGTWKDRTQYPPDAFWTGSLAERHRSTIFSRDLPRIGAPGPSRSCRKATLGPLRPSSARFARMRTDAAMRGSAHRAAQQHVRPDRWLACARRGRTT